MAQNETKTLDATTADPTYCACHKTRFRKPGPFVAMFTLESVAYPEFIRKWQGTHAKPIRQWSRGHGGTG